MITHDLGIIADICDRVGVMYAGNIVELGDTNSIFFKPLHPYTIGLIGAIPKMNTDAKSGWRSSPANVPNLIFPPPGCRFHPRCNSVMDICKN